VSDLEELSPLRGTRRALHGVAELVLAGPQYRQSGTIRLRVTETGFATAAAPSIEVRGEYLVCDGAEIPMNAATCGDLAAAIGVDVGAPEGLYHDGSQVAADEKLVIDGPTAAYLAECRHRASLALQQFAPGERPVLWPEHFDVAVTVDDVNYGASSGDAFSEKPYAYVGPHRLRDGDFWNAPFGAAVLMRSLPTVAALVEFFATGRRLASD
jgi:hypothetical protein